MQIVEYNNQFFQELIRFNIKSYPLRVDIEKVISYKLNYLCNEHSTKLLLAIDENRIIGQIFLLPVCFSHSQEIFYWGMDYIVDNDYRDSPAGVMLLRKVIKMYNHLGMAFSKLALKIHYVLGETCVGNMKLYIKPNMYFLNSVFKKIKLPSGEFINDGDFKISENLDRLVLSDDNEICMPERNDNFFNWRFSTFMDRDYYKIVSKDLSSYAVVRKVFIKRLPFLLLVDYRLDNYSPHSFKKIVKAMIKISKNENVVGILIYNTIRNFDSLIRKECFIRLKNIPILSNKQFSQLLITPADSDFEFNIN